MQSYLYRFVCDVIIGGYISSWVGTIWKQNLNIQIALDLRVFFWENLHEKREKKGKLQFITGFLLRFHNRGIIENSPKYLIKSFNIHIIINNRENI
jgi:hypothetical protein